MIPLSFGYSKGRSPNVSAGEDVNVYPCINSEDAKSPITLSERPGLKQLAQPVVGQVRAMMVRSNILYALIGTGFYEINLDTLLNSLIFTVGSATGKAWIEMNANSQVLVVAADEGWVYNWTTSVFGQIGDVDFPGARSLAFVQNYAVTVDPDSGRLRNCEVNNFEQWDGTAFVTAETAPDNLLAVVADHKEVIAFGAKTIEVYRNTGDVAAVFQALDGAFFEIGIGAAASAIKVSNVVPFLDDTLQVRMIEAYTPRIVSTPSITYQIAQFSTVSDAVGMGYVWNGHAFYVLSFPTADRSFIYDITASAMSGRHVWHEGRSYPVDAIHRWRGNCVYQEGKTVYVGDYENGWIYTMDENTHTDNLEAMQRVWTLAEITDQRNRALIFHHGLEVEVEMGVATVAVEDPQIALTYSDDNGRTWSNELWNSIGMAGEYQNRARWIGLGASRSRIYRFLVADNVKVEVIGAYLLSELGVF